MAGTDDKNMENKLISRKIMVLFLFILAHFQWLNFKMECNDNKKW
jgi:hypothetical protein